MRKGKLRKPTEFGYVTQLTELCENTRRGARGLILPASTGIGSLNEGHLLPATGQRLRDLQLRPREIALDGGFQPGPVRAHLPEPDRLFISGHHAPHTRKTNRRLAKLRVGAEGRISHLKRRYGLDRSRLKGHTGARTWAAWALPAYDLDTLALRTAQHDRRRRSAPRPVRSHQTPPSHPSGPPETITSGRGAARPRPAR